LGAYLFDLENESRQRSFPGPGLAQFSPPRLTRTRNEAIFGAFEADLSEQLTLALEGRYAEDEKKISGANGINAQGTFDSFVPRITLRHEATDDLMLYVLAAKGNKPGDFNTAYFGSAVPPTAFPGDPIVGADDPRCSVPGIALGTEDAIACGDAIVDEEEAWTYEAGIKSVWLGGALTANLAVFYIDWENQGQFTTVPVARVGGSQLDTVVVNAGLSQSQGLELETSFAVTDALLLIANYGYTDAEFVEFNSDLYAQITGINDAELLNGGNVAGFRLPNTPEHSVVFGVIATSQLTPELELFFRPDVVYESDRMADETNLPRLDSLTLVNLRTGVRADHWTATAYVTNLLDENTPTAGSSFVNFVAPQYANGANQNVWTLNPRRGRNWGIEFQYRY
jgi:outer membrane receptor protein involved in Fe transport